MRHLVPCAAFVASLSLVACNDESASPAASAFQDAGTDVPATTGDAGVDTEPGADAPEEPLSYEAVRLSCGGVFACCEAVLPCCPTGTVWPGGNGWPMLGPPLSFRDLDRMQFSGVPDASSATLVEMRPFVTDVSDATLLVFQTGDAETFETAFGIPYPELLHLELPVEIDLDLFRAGRGLLTTDGVALAAHVSAAELDDIVSAFAPQRLGVVVAGPAQAVCRYDDGHAWQVDVRDLLVTPQGQAQQTLAPGESIQYQWQDGAYQFTSHGGFLPPPFAATGGGQDLLSFRIVRQ